MTKRLFYLNGLAIIAVVCNHAGGWSQIALFWWADKYRPTIVPDWSQLGTFTYYFLLTIREIAIFCVPAFFFISGFFVSYIARDKKNQLKWTFLWIRIKYLLIPYLIWSIVIIVGDLLQNDTKSVSEYLILVFTRGVVGPYWFIPALCYTYLISPILLRLVQWNWRLALIITGLIHIIPVAIGLLRYASIDLAWMPFIIKILPAWLPFQWIFFFVSGICTGINGYDLSQRLNKYRDALFFLVLLTVLLNIIESDYLYRSPLHYTGAANGTITYNLYAIAFILWFLSIGIVPFTKSLSVISVKSYGIYLIHYSIIELTARIINKITPHLLANQIILFIILLLAGLGVPYLLMTVIIKSPLKQYYKYLFG